MSGSERTESEGPQLPADHPTIQRRVLTSQDYVEAEDFKRAVMSVIHAGGFASDPTGELDHAWPEPCGKHRPSLAERLNAERRLGFEQELEKLNQERNATNTPSLGAHGSVGSTQRVVEALRARAVSIAESIHELPIPSAHGIGREQQRRPCGVCANCTWNERRRATMRKYTGNTRQKTSKRQCMAIRAVEAYKDDMGYLNGNDMLRIVQEMQKGVSGATGRGVRCGKCGHCLAAQGKPKSRCSAVAAILNKKVPVRLMPVVKLAAAETEDRMLLSYPYIKQVDELRKTGVEWLLTDADSQFEGSSTEERGKMEDELDDEEAYRWGTSNISGELGARSDSDTAEDIRRIGRALKHSAFGRAVGFFDDALMSAIRERHSLAGAHVDECEQDRLDCLGMVPPEEADPASVSVGAIIGDGSCAVHTRRALANQSSTPVLEDDDVTTLSTANKGGVSITPVVHTVRAPLYRLLEDVLNEASIKLARKAIPVQYRNKNAADKRIFQERTNIGSFPELPVHALDWYAHLVDNCVEKLPEKRPVPHTTESMMKQARKAPRTTQAARRGGARTERYGRGAGRDLHDEARSEDDEARSEDNTTPTPLPRQRPANANLLGAPQSGLRTIIEEAPQHDVEPLRPSIDELLDRLPAGDDVRLVFQAARNGPFEDRVLHRAITRFISAFE